MAYFDVNTSKVFKTLEVSFNDIFQQPYDIYQKKSLKIRIHIYMGSNNKTIFLKPGRFYHIYNRACGFEKLFLCDSNFRFFMDKFSENLQCCVSLYAYCLMPNHFHFLVKTKDISGIANPDKTYSRKFSNFFNSYAKSFNKFSNRKGGLFSQNFKKKEIDSIEYLRSVTLYIHQNPVKHGYVDKIDKWKYSSYKETISGKSVYCQGNIEIIGWFNSMDILKFCHKIKVNMDLD